MWIPLTTTTYLDPPTLVIKHFWKKFIRQKINWIIRGSTEAIASFIVQAGSQAKDAVYAENAITAEDVSTEDVSAEDVSAEDVSAEDAVSSETIFTEDAVAAVSAQVQLASIKGPEHFRSSWNCPELHDWQTGRWSSLRFHIVLFQVRSRRQQQLEHQGANESAAIPHVDPFDHEMRRTHRCGRSAL